MQSELLLPSSDSPQIERKQSSSVSVNNNEKSASPLTQLRTKDQILKSMKAHHRNSFVNSNDSVKHNENNNNNNSLNTPLTSALQQHQDNETRRNDKFFRPGACAFLPPAVRNPLKTFWKFLNKLNYVAVLLTFTACCCLFFAIVLYIHGPMTRLETDLIVTVTSTKFNVSFFDNNDSINASWKVLSQVHIPLTFQDVRQNYDARKCLPFKTINPAMFDPLINNNIVMTNEDSFNGFYFLNESSHNNSTPLLPQRSTESFVGYNITTITNFTRYEFAVAQRGRLAFREALFVSVSAFTASGLSTVDYSFWTTGPLTTIAFTMTFGSTVLLTILPAILRYFALVKERKKLIQILLSTGAYGNDDDEQGENAAQVGNNNNNVNEQNSRKNGDKSPNLNSLRIIGSDDHGKTLASPTAEQISRVGLIFLDGTGDTMRIPYPTDKRSANKDDDIDHDHDEAKNMAMLSFFDDDDTNEKVITTPTVDSNTGDDHFLVSANSINNYNPNVHPNHKPFSSDSPSDNASFSSVNNNNNSSIARSSSPPQNNNSKSSLQSPIVSPPRNHSGKLSPPPPTTTTTSSDATSIKSNTTKSDRKRSNTILGFSPPSPNSQQQQQQPPSSSSSLLRSSSPQRRHDNHNNINNTSSASTVPLISFTNASSDFTNGTQQSSVITNTHNNNNNNVPSAILLKIPLSSELTKEDSQDTIPKSLLVHSNSGNSSAKHSGTFLPPTLIENNDSNENRNQNETSKINKDKNNDNNSAAIITFGQRIVYEDGLAHVNQQIDICIIIIFGAIFYTLVIHLICALIITIFAPSEYWNFGFSLFHVISCFNNAGFAMGQIFEVSGSPIVMLVMIFLMVAGNSLYPIFFRLMLQFLHWTMRKYTTSTNSNLMQQHRATTKFIFGQPVHVWQHSLWLFLRYPRRFYTHMFSPRTSLVLFGVWSVMTIIGCLLMIPEMYHSDLLSPDVPEAQHYKWLIALFQTVSVRQTGIAIIRLDRLTMGQLAWWVLAMYLAAYPFILTVRSSSGRRTETATSSSAKNEDDEKAIEETKGKRKNNENHDAKGKNDKLNSTWTSSLATSSSSSSDDSDVADEEYAKSKNGGVTTSVVQEEATAVMARDIFWLYLAIILICYCENQYTVDDTIDHDYSIYLRITFEVISSFANVGLSLNIVGDVPNASYAASLKNVLSPLILIVVMYFGKHRGLPQNVDEAISIHVRKYEFSGDYNPDDEENNIGGKRRANQYDSADVSMTEFPDAVAIENDVQHKTFNAAQSLGRVPSIRKTFSVRKREIFKLRIENFYSHYNPARIPQVERIISAFETNPEALLRNLEATYGPDVNNKEIERQEKILKRKMMSEKNGGRHHHQKNRSNSTVQIPSAEPSLQNPDI